MSKQFRSYVPGQRLLFPPTIEEFVPANHTAHFVRRIVSEELDLELIINNYNEERGAPPYDPTMMVALLLYAYMRGEYSSRRIAEACVERVDFMAITAMNYPDFRTIAKFRVRHMEALQELFVQVVRLCQESNLVELKHVAIDGTKLKGNASWSKNKTYKGLKDKEHQIELTVEEWFKKAEALDKAEDEEYGKDDSGTPSVASLDEALKKIREAKEKLKQREQKRQDDNRKRREAGVNPRVKYRENPRDEEQYNFTDPDTRLINTGGGYMQGYNGQAAVDDKCQVIVSCHVSSTCNDKHELEKTLPSIRENCGVQAREVSADSDYCTEWNLRLLNKYKVRGYLAVGKGRRDPAIPANAPPKGSLRYRMALRLQRAGRRTRYRLRKITVEPVFGMIKAARRFRGFLMRGIKKVNTEWALVCMAHNLWKIKNYAT